TNGSDGGDAPDTRLVRLWPFDLGRPRGRRALHDQHAGFCGRRLRRSHGDLWAPRPTTVGVARGQPEPGGGRRDRVLVAAQGAAAVMTPWLLAISFVSGFIALSYEILCYRVYS